MSITIGQDIYSAIDTALQSTMASGTAKVMLGVGALFGTFWLLHFTIRGIYWLYMGMTAIFQEIVFEIGKLAIFGAIAFNVPWFVQTVVPFVTDGPSWMGGLLSGQEGDQINQIDTMITTYADSLITLIKAQKFSLFASFSTILFGALAVGVYLVGGATFLLVAVGTSIILKIASTLMLVVGPLFLAFALFDKTKHWFWSWISVIAGFMLTQVLFSVVMALEISFVNTFIIKDGVIDSSIYGVLIMLVCFSTFAVLATELPNYAASVMGGTPTQTSGIAGLISKGSGIGAAVNAARGAKNMLGKMKGRNNIS